VRRRASNVPGTVWLESPICIGRHATAQVVDGEKLSGSCPVPVAGPGAAASRRLLAGYGVRGCEGRTIAALDACPSVSSAEPGEGDRKVQRHA
jgi:hypothetical protein